jgi:hypothetical protein
LKEITTFIRLECLPDTVDPRGPKGKWADDGIPRRRAFEGAPKGIPDMDHVLVRPILLRWLRDAPPVQSSHSRNTRRGLLPC